MRALIAFSFGLALIVLAACSSASAPSAGGGSSGSQALNRTASDAAAPRPAAQEASAKTSGASSASATDAIVPRLDRMVIANISLNASAENAVTAAREAERIAIRYGGYVGSSNVRDLESGREATMTLKIPVPNMNDALTDLRAVGQRVIDETGTTDDVTEEYTDVASNVRNLRATEAQILGLMERTTRIDEILTLQRELTNIRGQIERLEGRRRVLESRTSYANIAMRFTEPMTVAPRPGWTLLEPATQALSALTRVGQVFATAAVWLLVFAPVYGIPIALGWWFRRQQRPVRSGIESA